MKLQFATKHMWRRSLSTVQWSVWVKVRDRNAASSQFDFRTVNASLCLGEKTHFITLISHRDQVV